MSKRRYKRGAKLKTIGQFANCGATWYIVRYPNGTEKTTHRAWLISMQYRCLAAYIKGGRVFVAREVKSK